MVKQNKLNTPEKRARVGERIKVAATQAGLSLKELAEHAEVSPSAIYQYVRGITAIPLPLLERIAAVTRVHASFFDPEQDARLTLALPMDTAAQHRQEQASQGDSSTRTRIEAELRQARALADAYSARYTDGSARLSALEQMLALSRALENRERQARILLEIGRVRMEAGDFSGAQSTLQMAREYFSAEKADAAQEAGLDLARCLIETESYDAARECLQEILAVEASPERWRAQILLGRIAVLKEDYSAAITHYEQAAEAVLARNSPQVKHAAQLPLTIELARLAEGAGHFGAARTLWKRAVQQAQQEHDIPIFLQVVTEFARCLNRDGNLLEARRHLETALTIAGFWPSAERSLTLPRTLLVQIELQLDEPEAARENARAALRIAHRHGGTAEGIAAQLAVARVRLASRQWAEALDYAQDALDEALRAVRTGDVAAAHLIRAAAHRGEYDALRSRANDAAAERTLHLVQVEAHKALEAAERAQTLELQIEAQWMLAEICAVVGSLQEAEQNAQAALAKIEAGPQGLKGLSPSGMSSLFSLLSMDVDLPSLLSAGDRLELPMLEWRLHTLIGTLETSRRNPDSAYASFLQAAEIVWGILSHLTPSHARAFATQYPDLHRLMEGFEKSSATSGAKKKTSPLLDLILMLTEQTDAAVVGAERAPVA